MTVFGKMIVVGFFLGIGFFLYQDGESVKANTKIANMKLEQGIANNMPLICGSTKKGYFLVTGYEVRGNRLHDLKTSRLFNLFYCRTEKDDQ